MSTTRSRRAGLLLVMTATLFLLDVGFVHKSVCLRGDFTVRAYHDYCYTDIVPLYHLDGFARGAMPYVSARNEYPVVTGLFMWVASLPLRGGVPFFLVNCAMLLTLGLVVAWLLFRKVGRQALFYALAPSLALYAFLNWDLLVVFFATAAVLAFLDGQDRLAGILLGLGAAAKLYPALIAVPLCLDRFREGDRRGAVRIMAFGVCTWSLANLPFAVGWFDRWSYFFRLSSSRPPSPGTLWYTVCYSATGTAACGAVEVINLLSLGALALGCLVLWRVAMQKSAMIPPWTLAFPFLALLLLTNKVYSPQYALWIIPFFALVMPNLKLFLAFAAADVLVFFTEFSWIARQKGLGGLPAWPLSIAVLIRARVLATIVVSYVRSGPSGVMTQARQKSGPTEFP